MRLTDIHCHILPGVDDGPDRMEETKAMLRMEYDAGVRTIIATPHYREDMFETPMKRVYQSYMETRELAKAEGIRLYLGCEYHTCSRMVKDLKKKRRPGMAGSRFVLTEFSAIDQYEKFRRQIYDLIAAGYHPVVAHAERYSCLREQSGRIEELIDLGAYIQINAGAVLGEGGSKIKKFCRQIMEEDLVHFIASDAHGARYRKPNLGTCAEYISKKMGRAYAEKIFCENPVYILEDARKMAKIRKKIRAGKRKSCKGIEKHEENRA